MYNQRNYQQSQVYAQTNIQQQNEISYTLNQDLQNVLGVALEFYAVEKNSGRLNPDLVQVQKNRLIVQYNLSNSINMDLQQQQKSQDQKNFLKKKKGDLRDMFISIKKQLSQQLPDFQGSEAYQILQDYEKNNLTTEVRFVQKQPEEVNVDGSFNDSVLAKIVGSIQMNDQIYANLSSKSVMQFDDTQKILNKTLTRFENTNQRLNQQFSNPPSQCVPTQPSPIQSLLAGLYCYFKNSHTSDAQIYLQIIRIHLKLKQIENSRHSFTKLKSEIPSLQYFFSAAINYFENRNEEQNPYAALPKINLSKEDQNYLSQFIQFEKEFELKKTKLLNLTQILFQKLEQICRSEPIQLQFQIEDAYDLEYLNILISEQMIKARSEFTKTALDIMMKSLKLQKKNDRDENTDLSAIESERKKYNQIMN